MAQAALLMQVAGMFIGASGAASSAIMQQGSLNLDANISDINARLANLSADQATISGTKEKQSSQLKTASLKSTQRTRMAASGVDLGSQSAVQNLTTTDAMGEIDANTIESNTIKSAWGYKTKAVEYTNRAIANRSQAKSINPDMAMLTSMLGSAPQVADSWYRMKDSGAIS